MEKANALLIVDDMKVNRSILRRIFEPEYRIMEAENGEQALNCLGAHSNEIAAVLLDLVMPVMDGFQVLNTMKAKIEYVDIPVVIVTADHSSESELKAFEMGASDIVTKPFEPYIVRRRVKNLVELYKHRRHLEELVQIQAERLRTTSESAIDILSSMIEYRSRESGQHVLRIRMFTRILLENVKDHFPGYGLDDEKIRMISSAAALHDIGKIVIPDAILNKSSSLTDADYEIMKTHTTRGSELLSGMCQLADPEFFRYIYEVCRYHHERWDGGGYPEGLIRDNIPLCAQVVGLADAYDSLTTTRVYKQAYSPELAYNMILNGDCGAFSPELLECFKEVRPQFEKLTREYADGRSPRMDQFREHHVAPSTVGNNSGTSKYFSLLRYLDSTVVEVNLESGIFHVVYVSGPPFGELRQGTDFSGAVKNFADRALPPEEREPLLTALGPDMESFFQNGLMKQNWLFHVINPVSGAYDQYQLTAVRGDIENRFAKRAILIWNFLELGEKGYKNATEKQYFRDMEDFISGFQKFKNDEFYTFIRKDKALLARLGYTEEEVRGRFGNHLLELIDDKDREMVRQRIREQILVGPDVLLEYRLVAKSGERVWYLEKGRLVCEPDGQEYFYSVLLDASRVQKLLKFY